MLMDCDWTADDCMNDESGLSLDYSDKELRFLGILIVILIFMPVWSVVYILVCNRSPWLCLCGGHRHLFMHYTALY